MVIMDAVFLTVLQTLHCPMVSAQIVVKFFYLNTVVPRVQREEDQVRLVAPTQMALCLRP